jgi:hypothetical protein
MKNLVMAALAATLALGTTATAAEFNPLPDYPTTVSMTGDIHLGDDAKLYNVLQYRQERGAGDRVHTLGIARRTALPGLQDGADDPDAEHQDGRRR